MEDKIGKNISEKEKLSEFILLDIDSFSEAILIKIV